MENYTFLTYITNNYLTLLTLSALTVVLIVNRKMKIEGLNYFWQIMGIVFALTILEAIEDMCDLYGWDYRLLYLKTAGVYWLYPLTAMLEVYLIAPIRSRSVKFLLLIPYLVSFVIVFIDLFDMRIVYWFDENHRYQGGPLSAFPVLTLLFYVILLAVYSVIFLAGKKLSKGVIVLFMLATSIITAIGEGEGFAEGRTETVTAIEMLMYYFFLAGINYYDAQAKLYESRIELEQDRIKLLTAQIRPHFIFNSLATIQSICYTDGEVAAECIEIFGDYLRANINALSSEKPILFSSELEHIKQYVKLKKMSSAVRFDIVFDLQVKSFKIPPLTVQPIVENAISHGALTRRDGTGIVTLKTEETDGNIIITVTDNGIGGFLTDKQNEHRSVGITNVRKRLSVQCGGTLDYIFTDNGSTAVITIPRSSPRLSEQRSEQK